MNTVGIIMARLGLDSRAFQAGLKEATNMAGGFSAQLLKIPNLGGLLSGAGIAVGIRNLADYADKVEHLSQRFGVSTTVIQQWGNAAEENGSSMEAVAIAFNKLEVARSKAAAGDESMLAHFTNLGVTFSDLRSLAPDQLMKKLGASSGDAADMVALLGRNGTDLRPILQGIADGTIKFGDAISAIDVKRLADADKLLKEIGRSLETGAAGYIGSTIGVFDELKNAGVGAWKAISNAATLNFKESGKGANDFFNGLLKAIRSTPVAVKMFGPLATPDSSTAKEQPPTDADRMEESKKFLASSLGDQVREALGRVEILRLELSGHHAIAEMLKIQLDYEKKINEARRNKLPVIAEELAVERQLALAKAQQANEEKLKLSLADLAKEGAERSPTDSRGVGSFAREAMKELELARQAALRGGPDWEEEAARHHARASEAEARIPTLREGDKDQYTAMKNALQESENELRQIKANTQNLSFANK